MTKEYFIIVSAIAISLGTIFYIPKKYYRLALVSFLAFQVISWPLPLLFVQFGYFDFPVRLFPRATRVTFFVFYLFHPMIFAWFTLLFPHNSSALRRMIHSFIFISIEVWFIYFISVYTDLMEFRKGTMLFNMITLYIRFFIYYIIGFLYVKWFFKGNEVLADGPVS